MGKQNLFKLMIVIVQLSRFQAEQDVYIKGDRKDNEHEMSIFSLFF